MEWIDLDAALRGTNADPQQVADAALAQFPKKH